MQNVALEHASGCVIEDIKYQHPPWIAIEVQLDGYPAIVCFFTSRTMHIYRAPSQYQKIRLSVRSRKVSKSRDLYLELSDRSEIWQALRQQCCRCACQIAKRYDNSKYRSRGFETVRDLTERRLFGYWDGAQMALCDDLKQNSYSTHSIYISQDIK